MASPSSKRRQRGGHIERLVHRRAHEMGHAGGIQDDYAEIWSEPSYEQPALHMLVPGDPYNGDNVVGQESLMKANKVVRGRHFWHLAEWIRTRLPGTPDLQIRHGDPALASCSKYFLPHHAKNAKDQPIRSFLSYPFVTHLDVAKGSAAARYDAYFYPLGADDYSTSILPGRGSSPEAYDALLVIAVHVGVDVPGIADHDVLAQMAVAVTGSATGFNWLRDRQPHRRRQDLRALPGARDAAHGGGALRRPLRVQRVAAPERRGQLSGARLDAEHSLCGWHVGLSASAGPKRLPLPERVAAARSPTSHTSQGTEPAWPLVHGNHVLEAGTDLFWVAKKAKQLIKVDYDNLLRQKIQERRLHAVLGIGGMTSGIETPAGGLPVTDRAACAAYEPRRANRTACSPCSRATQSTAVGRVQTFRNNRENDRVAKQLQVDQTTLARDSVDQTLDPVTWGKARHKAHAVHRGARRPGAEDQQRRSRHPRHPLRVVDGRRHRRHAHHGAATLHHRQRSDGRGRLRRAGHAAQQPAGPHRHVPARRRHVGIPDAEHRRGRDRQRLHHRPGRGLHRRRATGGRLRDPRPRRRHPQLGGHRRRRRPEDRPRPRVRAAATKKHFAQAVVDAKANLEPLCLARATYTGRVPTAPDVVRQLDEHVGLNLSAFTNGAFASARAAHLRRPAGATARRMAGDRPGSSKTDGYLDLVRSVADGTPTVQLTTTPTPAATTVHHHVDHSDAGSRPPSGGVVI